MTYCISDIHGCYKSFMELLDKIRFTQPSDTIYILGDTCIFGRTPTFYIRGNDDYSVWLDTIYQDKVCIDCGCVHGGYLAAIRLDDGTVFYC